MGRARNTALASVDAFAGVVGARRGRGTLPLDVSPTGLTEAQMSQLLADEDTALVYLRRHGRFPKYTLELAKRLLKRRCDREFDERVGVLNALQHATFIETPMEPLLILDADETFHLRGQDGLSRCGHTMENSWQVPPHGRSRELYPAAGSCRRCDAGGEVAQELERTPPTATRNAAREMFVDAAALAVACRPPAAAHELDGYVADEWAGAMAEAVGAQLAAHPQAFGASLAEVGERFLLPSSEAKLAKLGPGVWAHVVGEHLRKWDDYDIPDDPVDGPRAAYAPWGRQSRQGWRQLLHDVCDEHDIDIVRPR